MSELIDNTAKRRRLLKHLILQLHEGKAPEEVKKHLTRLLGDIPYGDVVIVEQELIAEGLPQAEVLKLCDVHSAALKGNISQDGAKTAPHGHPVHTLKQENNALAAEIKLLESLFKKLKEMKEMKETEDAADIMLEIRVRFNDLQDVGKHYLRKENLLFPYLEKRGITGPPAVMWGKHDEVRELLKAANEAFAKIGGIKAAEAASVADFLLEPAIAAIDEMIFKEEQILFPMCMDTLDEQEWFAIYNQTGEIGYCLYDPEHEWHPENLENSGLAHDPGDRIQLPSGSFSINELTAFLNTLPVDVTFVDKDDVVRYFSQGKERIFHRSRAIIGRKVQLCHPPSSVHVVQKIIDDLRSGAEDSAAFWIELRGKFIHIEYFAMRDGEGQYLGTLEVSQDLTEKRKLAGEQRLLQPS